MTTLSAIVAAIVAALAVDHGAHDFSGSGAVLEGDHTQPPALAPFAAVRPVPVRSTPRARERWYDEECVVMVRLWAAADTTAARATAVRVLGEQAKAILETARKDGASALFRCRDFVVRITDPGTAPANVAEQYATAMLSIELTYRRTAGTQGA